MRMIDCILGSALRLTFRLTLSVSLVTTASAGEVSLVSVDGNEPQTSANGQFVVFSSRTADLVPNDYNDTTDVFLRDMLHGTVSRISVDSDEAEAVDSSSFPRISADGRFVTFYSGASNLVSDDNNERSDVFLRDLSSGTTTRISVNSNEVEASSSSIRSSISADGRFVAFDSHAANLVLNDNNAAEDVFLRDVINGTTTRVSVDSNGTEAEYSSNNPTISANGRFVAFQSSASNLVPDDTNGTTDVFLRDLLNETTMRISVNSSEEEASGSTYWGYGGSSSPSISSDGRFIAFESYATNLVPHDSNGLPDIFLRDVVNGTTTRVNVDSDGVEASCVFQGPFSTSLSRSISASGRYVAFDSLCDNLAPDDNNGRNDVFIRDVLEGTTTRVSVDSNGAEASGFSAKSHISLDGRIVVFISDASNLTPDDTNEETDVFLLDRGAQCDVNASENQLVLIDNVWSLVSPPCLPIGGATVIDVFGDDISGDLFDGTNASTATWAVWFFDSTTQNYSFALQDDLLTAGQGMWILQSTGNDQVVDLPIGSRSAPGNFSAENSCSAESVGCFSLPLSKQDSNSVLWTLAGIPISTREGVEYNALRILTDAGDCADTNSGCTVPEAGVQQILSPVFHRYNNNAMQYDQLSIGSTLLGWDSYWFGIYPNAGSFSPTLLIPEFRTAQLSFGGNEPFVFSDVNFPGGQVEQILTITNIGDSMATDIDVLALAPPFELLQGSACVNQYILAAGASCEVSIRFSGDLPSGIYLRAVNIIYDDLFQPPLLLGSRLLQGTITD